MRALWLVLVLLLPLAVADDATRTETRDYSFVGVYNPLDPCDASGHVGTQARVCFDIVPGEAWVYVRADETTSPLPEPIALTAHFLGGPYWGFCDAGKLPIPPGATTLTVEVESGWRSGWCETPGRPLAGPNESFTLPVEGTVTAAFHAGAMPWD